MSYSVHDWNVALGLWSPRVAWEIGKTLRILWEDGMVGCCPSHFPAQADVELVPGSCQAPCHSSSCDVIISSGE